MTIKKNEVTALATPNNKCAVGLDLSYSGTGVVVIYTDIEGGIVETSGYEFKAGKAGQTLAERAAELINNLIRVMPPAEACNVYMEGAAFGAAFRVFELGELAGAVKYALGSLGYTFTLVQPTSLKKFATGSGAAQKTFVAAMIATTWGFIHPSNNVTDAYVLARMAYEKWEPAPKVPKKKGIKIPKEPKLVNKE